MTAPDLPAVPDLRNLRDVGGRRTADGRTVRPGVLLRSGTVAFVDEGQVALLRDAGLRTRVDLRSTAETEEGTSPAWAAVDAVHLPVHAGGARWDFESGHLPEWVSEHYRRYAEHSGEALAGVARVVADADRHGVLVHCTAGKDRTGVAVALLLAAVGVTDEEVADDYALTAAQMPGVRDQFARLPAYQGRLAHLPAESFAAVPGTILAFLDRLRRDHGGPRDYLRAHGLTDTDLTRLETALLG